MIKVYWKHTGSSHCRVKEFLEQILKEEDVGKVIIKKNDFGKPYLEQPKGIYFNGSHSGDYLVCALSNRPIGVDIQEKLLQTPCLKLAKRFFTKKEYDSLLDLDEKGQREAFFRLWTQKESYMKYCGSGFSLPMNTFEIQEENGAWHVFIKGERAACCLKEVQLDCAYSLWVCGEEEEISLWKRK